MRTCVLLMGLAVGGACVTTPATPPGDERAPRERCLPASEVDVVRRVEDGRVVVEAVVTQQVCQGDGPLPAPVRLAEIQLRPERPACPIGELGAKRRPDEVRFEPAVASLFGARPSAERAQFDYAFRSFSSDARAFVIGCHDRGVEWLFVELPRPGLPPRVGFFDGDTVRFGPGHENVLFPTPPAPPVTAKEPPLPSAEDEPAGPEAPEPVPPRVTATGCPAERVDAQWIVRRFGSSARPPGERTMPGPETLERWALHLDGGTAALVAEEEKRPKSGPGAGVWACSSATTVQGAVERRGATVTLHFGSLVARCRESALPVQPAQARRHPKRLPQRLDEEGCDRYRWTSSAPVKTKALVCTGELPLNAPSVFAAPPGIERLVLENDCQEPTQRDALRLVPADGGVAPAL